jgi:phosphatidate cytidylyltransferase
MSERLFGYQLAFDHVVTRGITIAIVVLLVASPIVIGLLFRARRIGETKHRELQLRYRSWLVLAILIVVPVLAGAAWTVLAVTVLSLLCYAEYARATGLFREKLISFTVVVGIVAVMFSVIDHWYGFFVALTPLTVGLISALAVVSDRPKGYIQRVALGVFGFMLFGSALGHLAYMANDANYRPIILMVLLCVELNDVFAYISGHLFGRRKLAPNTSPNKTVGGALGALVLTTALTAWIGAFVFEDTLLDNLLLLCLLGIIISVVGQLGDLMLSSIKRDVGVKDLGSIIPGHGGMLDRFDSLILVAPVVFHYVGYFVGFGLDQPTRILSGR